MGYCRKLPIFAQKGKLLTLRLASLLVVGVMYDIISNESDSNIFRYLKKVTIFNRGKAS